MLPETKEFMEREFPLNETRSIAALLATFTADELRAYEIIRNQLWAGVSTFDARRAEDDQSAIMAAAYVIDTLKKCRFKITQEPRTVINAPQTA